MPGSFQDQNGAFQTFPEQKYFQNCIVIGELPADINLDQMFFLFHDIPFLKKFGRKLIPDLLNPHLKAVVVSYDNEKLARLCAFRVNQAISRTSFSLYDGNFLFHHCKHLDEDCNPRSRNVVVSGFDTNVPKNMYLDLFKVFGTVNYSEFCVEGEIPKARIEYTRATSAFAAVLCLQGTLSRKTLITMEIPLFPVAAIGLTSASSKEIHSSLPPPATASCGGYFTSGIEERCLPLSSPLLASNENQFLAPGTTTMPMSTYPSYERYFATSVMQKSPTTLLPLESCESYSPVTIPFSLLPPQEEFRGQCFLMCSMNCHSSGGRWTDWGSSAVEDSKHRQMEECTMGTLSFEISRKGLRERGATRYLSRGIFDNLDKVKEESLRVFLQAAKRKCMFYRNACIKEAMYSSSVIKQEDLDTYPLPASSDTSI